MFIIVKKFSECQRNVIYCDRPCYQKLLTFLYGIVLRHSLVPALSELVVLEVQIEDSGHARKKLGTKLGLIILV